MRDLMEYEPYAVNKPFWTSKKWIAMVVGIAVPVVNHFFGMEFEALTILAVVGSIWTYIFGQSYVDGQH